MRPDIDAIEQRAEAATGGPWIAGQLWHYPKTAYGYYATFPDESYFAIGRHPYHVGNLFKARDVDADFIAHARSDIPALIAYIRELEAKLDQES